MDAAIESPLNPQSPNLASNAQNSDHRRKCEKASNILRQVFHSESCGGRCGHPSCKYTSRLLEHINSCQSSNCSAPGCATTKKLIQHYRNCSYMKHPLYLQSQFCLICDLVHNHNPQINSSNNINVNSFNNSSPNSPRTITSLAYNSLNSRPVHSPSPQEGFIFFDDSGDDTQRDKTRSRSMDVLINDSSSEVSKNNCNTYTINGNEVLHMNLMRSPYQIVSPRRVVDSGSQCSSGSSSFKRTRSPNAEESKENDRTNVCLLGVPSAPLVTDKSLEPIVREGALVNYTVSWMA